MRSGVVLPSPVIISTTRFILLWFAIRGFLPIEVLGNGKMDIGQLFCHPYSSKPKGGFSQGQFSLEKRSVAEIGNIECPLFALFTRSNRKDEANAASLSLRWQQGAQRASKFADNASTAYLSEYPLQSIWLQCGYICERRLIARQQQLGFIAILVETSDQTQLEDAASREE